MRSEDIPGQEGLKRVFRQMVDEDRVPHALLLHTTEGGSGLALAIFLTEYLMCEHRSGGEPCGECPNCTKLKGMAHPDVHYIYPVNNNKTVKRKEDRHSDSFISDWRKIVPDNPFLGALDWYTAIDIENKQGFIGEEESSEVRRKLALRPFQGGHRVFIIWHADKMNGSFANKMLKSFEEPSEKTVFILVSAAPEKLLSTILSRVQVFREEYLDEGDLASFLQRKYDLPQQHALDIAFRAEGNIGQAIQEARQSGDPLLDEFKQWMRLAYARDLVGLFKWSEKMAAKSRDSQRQFISGALKVLDRCYRLGWLDIQIPMEGEEAAFYKNFSPFINTSNIGGFLDLLEQASVHIERNVYEKLVWFDSSISAVRLIHEGRKAIATT